MIGQTIGKYRVEERIGRGGMGTVYRATDETLHREVALKVLNAELNDPEIARRFRAEAVTVARLSHPGIATIYELFQHDGQWLMVMEFVRGETLERLVSRSGALPVQRAAELCMQALAALSHAHGMGVVHRDLKPANLMINETGVVKVMDFGIARVSGSEHLTNAGFMMGTPAYMAPEQVMGAAEVDQRADLYAMGVVFYRLTTAKLPFKGDTAFAMAQSQVNDPPTPVMLARPDLPLWVESIVARALAKSPPARFQNALEFHEALSRSLAGMPLQTIDDGSAPTELMATPTRTPLGMPALTTGPTVPMSPPVPVPVPLAPAPAPTQVAAKPAPPAASKPRRPTNTVTAVIAAVVLLAVIALAGRSWLVSQGSQEPPSAPPPATQPAAEPAPPPTAAADPAANPATPPASTPPVQEVPPPPPPVTASAPPPSPKPAQTKPQTPGRATAPPPTVTAPPPPVTDPGRAAGAADPGRPPETEAAKAAPETPKVDDSLVGFSSVKYLAVNGRRTTDRDVLVNFGGGQVSVLSRDGGGAILSIPYGSIRRATYVSARDPKWDTSLTGPPADLDVGSILRQSRHWLVLQTADSYAILRLDDQRNVPRFLDMIQVRTGVKIERPAPGK
ncbi:MAG TPA: serine/threonine-protein kinase [Vicinamibacterales bacterium]|nr:serine/threonine-protein kinase [Vicinamibacterales bacterium]